VRGMVTAWLGLIVLQAVSQSEKDGRGRVAGLFTDVNKLVKRALDPKVPAIPDRRNGAATATPQPGAQLPDGSWPTYNVPAPGHQNWPSFNVPAPRS